MSIILFLAVLFVLVLVHEFGHFIVAKWSGMRVDEFGIGFPPKLFGIKKGETEYTFNALPIGGFVKIFGEDGVNTASSPVLSEAKDRRSEALAEAGEGGEDGIRGESQEGEGGTDSIESQDLSRSFTAQNKWKQAAVLVAGVTMNILFAWVLMAIVFGIGINAPVSEAEAGPDARLTITGVLPESPAGEAMIEQGSVIKSVNAGDDVLATLSPSAFSEFITTHEEEPIILSYAHSGELKIAQLLPRTDIIDDESSRPAIGVALTQVDTVKRSVTESIKDSFIYTVTGLRDITIGISGLIWDSVRFKADFSQIAGPVGIVGLVGEASSYGLTNLLMFTAFISLNLAVINILPFPALDGGRLLLVAVEAVIRRPIKPEFVGGLNALGFILLILLMIAVTWNDIARIL